MAPTFQEAEVIRRDGQVYAVPYHWGFAFTHYRKDKLAKAPETFADLQAPELRGKVGLPDDPYAVISTFALFAGFPDANNLSREEFDATIKLLTDFKPQVRTVHAYGEEAQLLGRGDVLVDLPSFSGSLVAAREAKLDTAYSLLGAWSYVDCWMVLKDGPNLAGTYAMMNRSLSPEAQLETTKTSLANPVVDSAISALPEDLRYEDTEDVLAKAPLLPGVTVETDGGEVPFQEWLTAWQQFKG
jgi:putative spermidine/putrescine transport system substrate-binding protein/spermidine/putrescine transport system substrate-binding protein